MPSGRAARIFVIILLLPWSLAGCATTYIPISWDMGDKVRNLSYSDRTLAILFNRYDPGRRTLRGLGESFDEVMMPSEVKYHLGAYRNDTKLIYRNLYGDYSDHDLRDLMVHEFAHHIWFNFMSTLQKEQWAEHLGKNPTPLQAMVRRTYRNPSEYDTEDFAFTVEYARTVDLQALARLKLISEKEYAAICAELPRTQQPASMQGSGGLASSHPEQAQATP